MSGYMTYEIAEKRYGLENHKRKCIDGSITGCGNCVGYCTYREHPGFLTNELRKEHNCMKKQCNYYVEKKPIKQNDPYMPFASAISAWNSKSDNALSLARSLTKDFEGLRFMSAKQSGIVCELCYITISNEYELSAIANTIENEVGIKINMRKLHYSFENAVNLILSKACV